MICIDLKNQKDIDKVMKLVTYLNEHEKTSIFCNRDFVIQSKPIKITTHGDFFDSVNDLDSLKLALEKYIKN